MGVASCGALAVVLLVLPATARAQGVQVPPAVKQQAAEIQDHFSAVLDEECPGGTCYSVGCKVSRFDTLDQAQTSSLPGLEADAVEAKPQYRLASVLCEFAYEPTLVAEDLNNIRQRVRQKVKTVGVDVQLATRALQPKATEPPRPAAAPGAPPPPEPTWQAALWTRLLPFLPWFAGAAMATALALALIWGGRRLGRGERRADQLARLAGAPGGAAAPAAAVPTAHMLLSRIDQLRGELRGDKRLVELALRKHFEAADYDELCAFLRQFGPELLGAFKEKAEYREALGTLSAKYADKTFADDPAETWRFLDRLDRDMTAAKVRIDAEPLEGDFSFLATAQLDEFVGILRELNEDEAIAAVAYAPRRLRERFFAHTNPSFTAKFVEHLTRVEKMPDAFVRRVAQKLRGLYAEKGDSLRTARVDKIPLLEEALNALEPGKRRQLIASLGKDSPEFLLTVAPAVFLDDSLPLLPDALLTEVLLVCSPEEAGHYLAAFPWSPGVLAKVNPRLVEAIRPHMLAPPVEDDVLARSAREKIAAFIKRLHAQGTLDLRALNARLVGGAS